MQAGAPVLAAVVQELRLAAQFEGDLGWACRSSQTEVFERVHIDALSTPRFESENGVPGTVQACAVRGTSLAA